MSKFKNKDVLDMLPTGIVDSDEITREEALIVLDKIKTLQSNAIMQRCLLSCD